MTVSRPSVIFSSPRFGRPPPPPHPPGPALTSLPPRRLHRSLPRAPRSRAEAGVRDPDSRRAVRRSWHGWRPSSRRRVRQSGSFEATCRGRDFPVPPSSPAALTERSAQTRPRRCLRVRTVVVGLRLQLRRRQPLLAGRRDLQAALAAAVGDGRARGRPPRRQVLGRPVERLRLPERA